MFKKWSGIENHYQSKHIRRYFDFHQDMKDAIYIATEKIDGANFSIMFDMDGNVSYAKRSGVLGGESSFFNHLEVINGDELAEFIQIVSEGCQVHEKNIQIIGELFGPGINGRVNYGPDKQWRWFAIREYDDGEGRLLSMFEAEQLIILFDLLSYKDDLRFFVPIVKKFVIAHNGTFEDAVQGIKIDAPTIFSPLDLIDTNIMEGVVIRPYREDFYSAVGAPFIIKYKNEKFRDSTSEKKAKKEKRVDEKTTNIVAELRNLVNTNRTIDLFSKHGEIDRPAQIGEYIQLYYHDIVEDFEKSNPEIIIKDLDDKKYVNKSLNITIVGELKKYL